LVNQLGTNTMSRSPSRDARYATRKSPFIAYRVSENTAEAYAREQRDFADQRACL
jgi:hypothetical protein